MSDSEEERPDTTSFLDFLEYETERLNKGELSFRESIIKGPLSYEKLIKIQILYRVVKEKIHSELKTGKSKQDVKDIVVYLDNIDGHLKKYKSRLLVLLRQSRDSDQNKAKVEKLINQIQCLRFGRDEHDFRVFYYDLRKSADEELKQTDQTSDYDLREKCASVNSILHYVAETRVAQSAKSDRDRIREREEAAIKRHVENISNESSESAGPSKKHARGGGAAAAGGGWGYGGPAAGGSYTERKGNDGGDVARNGYKGWARSSGKEEALDPTALVNMIQESHDNHAIFTIAQRIALNRHPAEDGWLERWMNPCFCMPGPAIDIFKSILSQVNPSLTKRIIFAGLIAMARHFRDRIRVKDEDMDWVDYANNFIHCTTTNQDNHFGTTIKNKMDKRYTNELWFFQIRGHTTGKKMAIHDILISLMPSLFGTFDNIKPKGTAIDLNRISDTVLECISGAEARFAPLFEKLTMEMPQFMELVIIHGVGVVFRWAFELLEYHTLDETKAFFNGFKGEIIPREIDNCHLSGDDFNLRSQHMKNYLSALLHMTQPREGHVLQASTWINHYAMVKRDVCDFMFTFMGYYTNSPDGSKYVKFFPERMTVDAWPFQQFDEPYINQELPEDDYYHIDAYPFPRTEQKIQQEDRKQGYAKRLYRNGLPFNSQFLHDLDTIVDRLALICM